MLNLSKLNHVAVAAALLTSILGSLTLSMAALAQDTSTPPTPEPVNPQPTPPSPPGNPSLNNRTPPEIPSSNNGNVIPSPQPEPEELGEEAAPAPRTVTGTEPRGTEVGGSVPGLW